MSRIAAGRCRLPATWPRWCAAWTMSAALRPAAPPQASSAAIEDWIGGAQRDFLAAYRAALADAGRPELLDERLLGPLTAERICRELVYAARVLPRWLYAPMGTLRRFTA